MIKAGEKIPSVTLKILENGTLTDLETVSYFKGRKIILCSVPGAFTPTCDQKHLPDYVQQAATIKAQGIDEIIFTAINDAFVMEKWSKTNSASHCIKMLPDGNGDFAKALGILTDASGWGMGQRMKRCVFVVEFGIIKGIKVENDPNDYELSSANACVNSI